MCFLILTIAADLSLARPLRKRQQQRQHHRQHRSHSHFDDEEEEGTIEDETHDNLQLIKDIIQMVGFNLTFGRDGLKVHLGSRSNTPFPHAEGKSLSYRSSGFNAEPKNQVNMITGSNGKDATLLISGRPYLLIPMPENYGLIPMPVKKQKDEAGQKGKKEETTRKPQYFGQPVTSSTTTTETSEFVFPTLLTPNPVTDAATDMQ